MFDFQGPLARIGMIVLVVFIAAVTATWVLDRRAQRNVAAEGLAIEHRAFELSMRALTPGSALPCLDGTAGKLVEDACEKAVFASPEATASAVSYVTAQLSLLTTARQHARASGLSNWSFPTIRRAIEADRFGIAAYLFAAHAGCGIEQCDLFHLLQDSSRVKANLAGHTFQSYLRQHMADWRSAGTQPMASDPTSDSNAPAASPPPTARKPANNLFFPSSSSIPPNASTL